MESMALAYVTPKMLTWARTRASLTPEQACHNIAEADRLLAWESGEQVPTSAQVDALAKRFRVPLLALFLDKPPAEPIPLTDLRTIKGKARKKLSPNFRETIDTAIVRQDWYREEFPNAKPKILAKKFSISDDPTTVGEYIRRVLRINDDVLAECPTWEEFLARLAANAESAGILVLRSGVVRNSPRRKLDVEEVRGFALTDESAPLIFVNSNDTTTAQIFTLVHEIAHLSINCAGISNPDPTTAIDSLRYETELFCNKVAAEVLVPKQKFLRSWQSSLSHAENLKRIVRFFRVSNMVALRRAYDLGKIPKEYFFHSVKADYERFLKRKKEEEEKNKKSPAARNCGEHTGCGAERHSLTVSLLLYREARFRIRRPRVYWASVFLLWRPLREGALPDGLLARCEHLHHGEEQHLRFRGEYYPVGMATLAVGVEGRQVPTACV